MIVERYIAPYSIYEDETIVEALRKISLNGSHTIFAVTQSGILQGVMTDGDFRRWFIAQPAVELNTPVSQVMSRNFVTAQRGASAQEIESLFSQRIKVVPIVDEHNHLVEIALHKQIGIRIGDHSLGSEAPTFVIAEIGNNHNGSLTAAKRLIDEAKAAGADCAKFQMRQLDRLYANNGNANDASEDLGSQYVLDLLSRFSLSNDEMIEAFDYCKSIDITPLCTPWDEQSLDILEYYGMAAYKIASADLTNLDFIRRIIKTRKPIILSTGMSTEAEIVQTTNLLKEEGAAFVLLHCNSTYPVPFKDIQLRYIGRLAELSGGPVGYSGHERDINVAIAAVAMGAKVIEKHFTLDRDQEGNDHKVSLLPDEFARMVEGIRQIELAMGSATIRDLTQGEMMNRETLAKSVVAAVEIKEGAPLTADMITVRSPGKGLQPNRIEELLGRPAPRAMKPGDFFFLSDLESRNIQSRSHYEFRRPWGIPVRYHDYDKLIGKSRMDLLEFHLSYKDLEHDLETFFEGALDCDVVVHSPELFAGDHLLDLCSLDDAYRRRSVSEMQRVIDLTRSLNAYFPKTKRPLIVTNVGGFSLDRHLHQQDVSRHYERLIDSLSMLDRDSVEIIPQTMPPFPWHFGGQRHHNLFVDAAEIATFCAENGMRICLDISHSKLACSFLKTDFSDFIRRVGPYVAHMHLADAKGVDGEGLQIGEGEIDFVSFARVIDEVAPDASFIPEIWQGHKNDGEGFWVAMDRLETAFGARAVQR